MFTDTVNAARHTPDKLARMVNHVAEEVVGLYSYLGPKAYYCKKIVEGDEEITRISENVNRSIIEKVKKSYGKAFKNLSIEMNNDVHKFVKIHQNPRTLGKLELICLFGETPSPSASESGKTLFTHEMEAVMAIKKRYIESLKEEEWGAIDEKYGFVHMDVPVSEIMDGIIFFKNRIMELNLILRGYHEIT